MQIQHPASEVGERLISKVLDKRLELALYSLFWNLTCKSTTQIYLTMPSGVKLGQHVFS